MPLEPEQLPWKRSGEKSGLKGWVPDVKQFVLQESVRDSIAALFLQSDYYLDPTIFMSLIIP